MADLLFRELSEKQEAIVVVKDNDAEISKDLSVSVDSTVAPTEEGAGAWTVSTSTKTRRLAPMFTLSRKDLGTDSPRNIAAVQELAAAKKRVIRFTREELLGLRKISKVLKSMTEFSDIMSASALNPESLRPLEQDEVFRLWNVDREKNKDSKDKNADSNKGKGRGKDKDEEDEEWSKGGKDGVWDSIEGSSTGMGGLGLGGDLADFAAAALKFRSETRALYGLKGEVKEEEVDAMDCLFKEQAESEMLCGMDPSEEGLEEEEPEWAEVDVDDIQNYAPAVTSQTKRNLLFETLNIKKAAADSPAPQESVPPAVPKPQPLPLPQAEEWYYTDPQSNVQGPYETSSMRQWHEARYFSPDLPIKLKHWVGFHPLGVVFRDAEIAFRPNSMIPEPSNMVPRVSDEEAAQRLLAQRQQIEQQHQQQLLQQQQQQALQAQLQQQQLQQQQQQAIEQQRLEKQRRQQQYEQQQLADHLYLAREQAQHQQQQQQQQPMGQLQRRQLELEQHLQANEKERQIQQQRQREFERLQSQKRQQLLQQQQLQQQQQQMLQQRAQGQGQGQGDWDYGMGSSSAREREREREGMLRQQQQQQQEQQHQLQRPQGRGGSLQLKNLLNMTHSGLSQDQWSESHPHPEELHRDDRFSQQILSQQQQQEQLEQWLRENGQDPHKMRDKGAPSLRDMIQDGAPDIYGSRATPRPGQGQGGVKPPSNGARMPIYAQAPPPLGAVYAQAPPPLGPKNRPDQGMSPQPNLMDWSEGQLSVFSDRVDKADLRGMIEYCCQLDSPAEVRYTFSNYLGPSLQMNHFVSEFLHRREAEGGKRGR